MTDILKVKVNGGWQGIAISQGDVVPVQSDWEQSDNTKLDYIKNKPENLSDLTDDTSTNPIDKADTLTGLTSSVTELNYCDGVSSNIQTQLDGKASVDLSDAEPTSAFGTALNTAGIITIVETDSNGTSWYRVYSDGWCEQGGVATVTAANTWKKISLLKAYKDTNYSVIATNAGSAATIYGVKVGSSFKNETDGFYLSLGSGSTTAWWRASGYIS